MTKRTNDGHFLLRPDGTVEWILLYLLILKVNKFGLLLHGFVVMSNHIHLVVTDVRGNLPTFMCEFLRESGKAVKLSLGNGRRVWSDDRYSAVELLDRDAAERFIAYCQTNPTKAGLTLPKEWPGLTSATVKFGETLSSAKPELHFSANRPEWVECVMSPLPPMEGDPTEVRGKHAASRAAKSAEELKQISREQCEHLDGVIEGLVERSVEKILESRAARGLKKLAGAESVRQTSRETRANPSSGGIRPKFASKNRDRVERAIQGFRVFCIDHDEARDRYIEGETGVWFPDGTYGYRKQLRVRVRGGGHAA